MFDLENSIPDYDYISMPSSQAHTYGNVTAFITEYLKRLFPSNYFKTVNIASTIAYRHFNIFDNTNKEFIKKNKPMLIVRPRLDLNNDDTFLSKTYLTTHMSDNFHTRDAGNLQPFIKDPVKGIHMDYLMNRIKMNFDVTIIVESQMEQFNRALYFKNMLRQDVPFFINTALESNVPKTIMDLVAKVAEIDINNTKDFIDYLNGVSIYPITYKLRNSSGTDEFFRYYPTQIDAVVTNLSIDDGSKKGFVDDVYSISFTIETEFTTAGLYFLFASEPSVFEKVSFETDVNLTYEDASTVKPTYTLVDLFTQETPPGWVMYSSPFYKVETFNGPDELDFTPLLNKSLQKTLAYQKEKGLPYDMAVRVFVYKDNEQLSEQLDQYSVDYENFILTTKVINTTSTYRMVIYVNMLYINTLVSDLLDFEEEK